MRVYEVLLVIACITPHIITGADAKKTGFLTEQLIANTNGTDFLLNIRMPNASPEKKDAYLCTGVPKADEDLYITRFEPLGTSADKVHHLLVFSCPFGANEDPIWDCDQPYKVCLNHTITFSWARNAPATHLPEGVGFRIAKGVILVMQLHYVRALGKEGVKDGSGVRLHVTRNKPRYLGGILLLATARNIRIPPHRQNVTADMNCLSKANQAIYFFGFQTHTHNLGTVITGYKYHPTHKKYELFAKGNPQWPEGFYPLNPPFEILPKDAIAGQCVYDSTSKDVYTGLGRTQNDEMCNLYIMFYTDMESYVGSDYYECFEEEVQLPPLPASSLIPPPKNATLEGYAVGHIGHSGHTLQPVMFGSVGPHGAEAEKSPAEIKFETPNNSEDLAQKEPAVKAPNSMQASQRLRKTSAPLDKGSQPSSNFLVAAGSFRAAQSFGATEILLFTLAGLLGILGFTFLKNMLWRRRTYGQNTLQSSRDAASIIDNKCKNCAVQSTWYGQEDVRSKDGFKCLLLETS